VFLTLLAALCYSIYEVMAPFLVGKAVEERRERLLVLGADTGDEISDCEVDLFASGMCVCVCACACVCVACHFFVITTTTTDTHTPSPTHTLTHIHTISLLHRASRGHGMCRVRPYRAVFQRCGSGELRSNHREQCQGTFSPVCMVENGCVLFV
jgi:hypothetical protein